jgi:hypothetical protein
MGPTKLVLPLVPNQPPPMPVMVAAHELLDQLYEETVRLLHEKEPALHHLAKALIERDEIIGPDLEEVFAEIETRYPQLRQPFERKIIRFREFAPQRDREERDWKADQADDEEQPAARLDDDDGPGIGWTPPVGDPMGTSSIRGMDPSTIPPWATTHRP